MHLKTQIKLTGLAYYGTLNTRDCYGRIYLHFCQASIKRLFRLPRRGKLTLHLTTRKPRDSKYHTVLWTGTGLQFTDNGRNYQFYSTPWRMDRLLRAYGIREWSQQMYVYLTYK